MSVENIHINQNWLLLLPVLIAIISVLYWYSTTIDLESDGEVAVIEVGMTGKDDEFVESGLVGPQMKPPTDEIEKEEPHKVIVEDPPFDSIRPFPKSRLPEHVDSMWFHASNDTDWGETLDSISLIVKGKEMTLRPRKDNFGFFNYIRNIPQHNIQFQDLNQNGYDDIKVTLGVSGATGNFLFDVFLYSDIDTTYLYNREFSSYSNISIDKDGFYHSSGKAGWGNYRGIIMNLNIVDENYNLIPFVTYRQR